MFPNTARLGCDVDNQGPAWCRGRSSSGAPSSWPSPGRPGRGMDRKLLLAGVEVIRAFWRGQPDKNRLGCWANQASMRGMYIRNVFSVVFWVRQRFLRTFSADRVPAPPSPSQLSIEVLGACWGPQTINAADEAEGSPSQLPAIFNKKLLVTRSY